jgi:hypothetical protein
MKRKQACQSESKPAPSSFLLPKEFSAEVTRLQWKLLQNTYPDFPCPCTLHSSVQTCTNLEYKPHFLYLHMIYSKPFGKLGLNYQAEKTQYEMVSHLVSSHRAESTVTPMNPMKLFLDYMEPSSTLGEFLIRLDGVKMEKAAKEAIENVQNVLNLWFPIRPTKQKRCGMVETLMNLILQVISTKELANIIFEFAVPVEIRQGYVRQTEIVGASNFVPTRRGWVYLRRGNKPRTVELKTTFNTFSIRCDKICNQFWDHSQDSDTVVVVVAQQHLEVWNVWTETKISELHIVFDLDTLLHSPATRLILCFAYRATTHERFLSAINYDGTELTNHVIPRTLVVRDVRVLAKRLGLLLHRVSHKRHIDQAKDFWLDVLSTQIPIPLEDVGICRTRCGPEFFGEDGGKDFRFYVLFGRGVLQMENLTLSEDLGSSWNKSWSTVTCQLGLHRDFVLNFGTEKSVLYTPNQNQSSTCKIGGTPL